MAVEQNISPALLPVSHPRINLIQRLHRWRTNRRLVAATRKHYREAKRIYRHCPCKATLDDLTVARECYERIR